jgi:hypothetical protein
MHGDHLPILWERNPTGGVANSNAGITPRAGGSTLGQWLSEDVTGEGRAGLGPAFAAETQERQREEGG